MFQTDHETLAQWRCGAGRDEGLDPSQCLSKFWQVRQRLRQIFNCGSILIQFRG